MAPFDDHTRGKTDSRVGLNLRDGGAEGVRTPDLLNAIQALYQLSYDPVQSISNVPGRSPGCQNHFVADEVMRQISVC